MNKKLIATVLAVIISVSVLVLPASAAASKFKDVKPTSWYYSAVDFVTDAGLFQGTSSTTFSPNGTFTRGMIVKVLGDLAGIDTAQYSGSRFSDVKVGSWYAPYVEWAVQNGIVEGNGNGKFAPDRNVLREQMAVIFFNYAKYQNYDRPVLADQLRLFTDGKNVSKPAQYAMEWAVTNKIFQGSGGKLNPQGTITRAEVAQVFLNCKDYFGLTTGGPSKPEVPADPTPNPSPAPDSPKILITDEVRAKLKSNQDPEKILEYVLHGKNDDPTFAFDGTTAEWDASLVTYPGTAKLYLGSWENVQDDMRSSSMVAGGFVQMLTHTDSDRFYITAEDEDGCFCMYYHPTEKSDSQKMKAVKSLLNLPSSKEYDPNLRYEGSGWAGPLTWDLYGGAQGIVEKVEYYLLEMHSGSKRYCLTEPEPGVFYLLYSY